MAIAVAQSQAVTNGYSGSFGSNVTAGDTIFLLLTAFNTSNVTISSSSPLFNGSSVTGASLLTSQQSPYAASATIYTAVWMLPNVSGGAKSFGVTVTNGTLSGNIGVWAFDISGLGSTPTLDQSNTGNGSTGTATVTCGSITQAPEIILVACKQYSTTLTGPGGGWNVDTLGTSIAGYQIVTSSGSGYTFSPAGTGSSNPWSDVIATVYGPSGVARTRTAALTVTPTFSAARTRGRYRTGSLAVSPSFSAARVRGRSRTAALTVTPSFSAARAHGHGRTGALSVVPAFSAARAHGHGRTGALSVVPAFSAAASRLSHSTTGFLTASDASTGTLTARDGLTA